MNAGGHLSLVVSWFQQYSFPVVQVVHLRPVVGREASDLVVSGDRQNQPGVNQGAPGVGGHFGRRRLQEHLRRAEQRLQVLCAGVFVKRQQKGASDSEDFRVHFPWISWFVMWL